MASEAENVEAGAAEADEVVEEGVAGLRGLAP
jgi:hypothetical protein